MDFRSPRLALAAVSLAALGTFLAADRAGRQDPKPAPARPGATFQRVSEELDYVLTYGWRDFRGGARRLSFPISKRDLTEAEREFGYTDEELGNFLSGREVKKREAMIARLKAYLAQLIERSGQADFIQIVDKGALTFDLKLSAPAESAEEVRPAFEAIKAKVSEEMAAEGRQMARELEEERREFLRSRGLVVRGDTLRVDYKRSVGNNQPRVKLALEALRRVDPKSSLRDFLSLSLAFIQDLANGEPPLVEGTKNILGFWVPPKVLANNFGDCDSKGAAFAALWANFKKVPVILIKVPDHMFIGVGLPGFPSETVTINGMRYTLCEVTGAQKIPPGLLSQYSLTYLQSGRYQYERVTQ